MLGRFWSWLTGNQKVEVNLKIQIEDFQKLIEVLPQYSNQPVIINSDRADPGFASNNASSGVPATRSRKKKLADDPLSPGEVASIMLSDGIEKATDRTGGDVVSASEGKSTDDTVSSLRKLRGGKKKDV